MHNHSRDDDDDVDWEALLPTVRQLDEQVHSLHHTTDRVAYLLHLRQIEEDFYREKSLPPPVDEDDGPYEGIIEGQHGGTMLVRGECKGECEAKLRALAADMRERGQADEWFSDGCVATIHKSQRCRCRTGGRCACGI